LIETLIATHFHQQFITHMTILDPPELMFCLKNINTTVFAASTKYFAEAFSLLWISKTYVQPFASYLLRRSYCTWVTYFNFQSIISLRDRRLGCLVFDFKALKHIGNSLESRTKR
jgi:hypothetical protein